MKKMLGNRQVSGTRWALPIRFAVVHLKTIKDLFLFFTSAIESCFCFSPQNNSRLFLLYTSKQLRIVFVVHLKATPLLLLPPLLHSLLLVPEGGGGGNKQTKEQLQVGLQTKEQLKVFFKIKKRLLVGLQD